MAYLEIKGISKHFGGLQALDNCAFSVEHGIVTCLVGPNGAGKTTIFNVITGFLRPDGGSVTFQGRDLTGLGPQDIVREGIARTFQNLRLFPDMTVIENVLIALPGTFGAEPLGALFRPFTTKRLEQEKAQAAHALLERVGLAARAGDTVRNLSYGEQKLLSIARVLATGAELLLLDEPASGIDADMLDVVVELLRDLQESGKTLLVVEHNTRVVQRIASQVVFLHQGRTLAHGTPERITSDPELAEIYFGGVL